MDHLLMLMLLMLMLWSSGLQAEGNHTSTVPFRLVGGDSRCAGTLEMKHQGEWRPVYGSDWNLKKAAVFCGVLDCGSAVSVGRRNESSERSVWRIDYHCLYSASAFEDCVESNSSSSILDLTCSDPTPLNITVSVVLLILLLVTVGLYSYCKSSRGQMPCRQENTELDHYNLGVPADEEEGAQGAE